MVFVLFIYLYFYSRSNNLLLVLGTKWILEISRTDKIKPLIYVSTFGTRASFGASYDIESYRLLERQEG